MKFTIPQPLQHEHEVLHDRLRQATQAGGEVGKVAKTLARPMHTSSLSAASAKVKFRGSPAVR